MLTEPERIALEESIGANVIWRVVKLDTLALLVNPFCGVVAKWHYEWFWFDERFLYDFYCINELNSITGHDFEFIEFVSVIFGVVTVCFF